jgi:hypothetical protein
MIASRSRRCVLLAGLASALVSATAGHAHASTKYPSIVGVGSHTHVVGYCNIRLGCYREEVYDVTVDEMLPTPLGDHLLPTQSIPVADQSASVGTGVVRVADIDGDGISDLVFWTPASVDVAWGQTDPTGAALFSASVNVYTGAFYGSTANLVGDVDGDGVQDLVAWSPSAIQVMYGQANRGGFATPLKFSSAPFAGSAANLLEDLNLDGKADFIAWSGSNISVEISDGYWGQAPATWASGSNVTVGNIANLAFPYGPHQGKDWEWPSLWAMSTNGLFMIQTNAQFDSFYYGFDNQLGSNQTPFGGSVANFELDVNGDGYDDLVLVNPTNVYVAAGMASSSFFAPKEWASSSPGGSLGVYGGFTSR